MKKLPKILGLKEVADELGWDQRKLSTYLKRDEKYRADGKAGIFPEPIQRVAATPLWTRDQIEEYQRSRNPGE